MADLLRSSGLVTSRSAGRRAIAEGGAYVNNVRVEGEDAEVGPEDLLHGRWLVIRRGRRSLAAIDMAELMSDSDEWPPDRRARNGS